MSELPELPPAPRRTRPLMPGGLETAMASGRRRRQRAMAATGGAGAALVLVVAAALVQPGDQRRDSLQVARTPTPVPTVVVTELEATPGPDVPEAAATAGAAGPSGAAAPGDGSVPVPGLLPAPRESRQAGGPDARGSDRTGEAPPKAPAARPAFVEDTDEDAAGSAGCAPTGMAADAAAGSCTYSSGGATPEIIRRGEQAQIVLGFCTSSDDIGDHIFFFDSGQEKDVVVVDENDEREEVFRFSSTVRYVQGPHEQRLRPGRCIQWTGRWNLVTTSGKPVPAGTYRVTMRVRADREVYENGPPVETPLDTTVSARFAVVD